MFFDHASANQTIFNLSTALAESKRQYREVMQALAQEPPWQDDDYGRRFCFYCVSDDDEPHKIDCLWQRAVAFCKALGLDYYKES